MAKEMISARKTAKYQEYQNAALQFLGDMERGTAKRTPFARQVATYIIDHPKDAANLAEHHYQSFYANRQKGMVKFITGNRLKDHVKKKYSDGGRETLKIEGGRNTSAHKNKSL